VPGGIMLAHATNHLALGGKVAGTARWFAGLGLRHTFWLPATPTEVPISL
jgi:hypothetical protein